MLENKPFEIYITYNNRRLSIICHEKNNFIEQYIRDESFTMPKENRFEIIFNMFNHNHLHIRSTHHWDEEEKTTYYFLVDKNNIKCYNKI